MVNDKKRLLKNYIANLKVNVEVAEYTNCYETWRELNYIPEFNKLYFICDGEGWLKIGDREYYPKPGELYLMPAGVIQSFSAINSNTFKKFWCHFTATVGDKNLFDVIRIPDYINVKDINYLTDLFRQLITCSKSRDIADSLRTKAVLLQIIAFYLDNAAIEDILIVESESILKLNYVMNYIENNMSENISVEELARMLHFHPNYFIKFFKNHLGSSPIHYINKRKMEIAKNLLCATEMTITEIALSVGFKDIYYFSKSFKAFTGFSPSEYKESVSNL